MNDHHERLLSDLFDGEPVDADALAEALAEPDAGNVLVRMARLRELVRDDDRRPDEAFYRSMRAVLERKRPWILRGPMLPLPVAAAAGLCLIAASSWFAASPAPSYAIPAPPAAGAPASAVAIVVPPPVPSPASVSVVSHSPRSPRPPQAKQMVRFVEGADWHTTGDSGSHNDGPR